MEWARNALEKQGWDGEHGLGKDGHGIKEAVKVKLKFDKRGESLIQINSLFVVSWFIQVGEDGTTEFTYNWWDHAFNKAANNIEIERSPEKKGKVFYHCYSGNYILYGSLRKNQAE